MIFKTTTDKFGTRLGTNFGNIKDFFARQNILSDPDMNAIRAYNAQIDACVTSQTAFNRTMLNASVTAQTMVEKANGNTFILGNLTKASKASAFGMNVLSNALNAVAFFAIAQAISAVVSWLNSYVNAVSNTKESSEALTQKIQDFNSTVSKNAKTNDELIIFLPLITTTLAMHSVSYIRTK